MIKIGFIGAGTVGIALATLLNQKGYPVAAVSSRTRTSAERLARMVKGCRTCEDNQEVADIADLIFITTPDDMIPQIAAEVAWRQEQSVVHCNGADSTIILQPARKAGARTGVIHPLQTFAGVKEAVDNLPGSTFALEAEEPLLGTLKDMVAILGGKWIELSAGEKALYHVAAVIASNYLVTLVKMSTDLWQKFNIPPAQAIEALLPLLRGTVNNLEKVGLPGCLTGPIARGDAGTVKKHIAILQKEAPALLAAYCELGRQTVPIALAKGNISPEQAQNILNILEQPLTISAG